MITIALDIRSKYQRLITGNGKTGSVYININDKIIFFFWSTVFRVIQCLFYEINKDKIKKNMLCLLILWKFKISLGLTDLVSCGPRFSPTILTLPLLSSPRFNLIWFLHAAHIKIYEYLFPLLFYFCCCLLVFYNNA